MQDCIRLLIARIDRAAHAVIDCRRVAGDTARHCVAELRPVAEGTVVASRVIRGVPALARLGTGVYRAGELVVTDCDPFRHAGAVVAFALGPAILRRQFAQTPVRLVLELTSGILCTGINSAVVSIVAIDLLTTAFQIRSVAHQSAFIAIGAGIAVVASNSIVLPIKQTGIGSFFGLLVAPRLLAWMLSDAAMRLASLALAVSITRVVIGTGVSIFAWMAFGVNKRLLAQTGGRLAVEIHAVIRIGVSAFLLVPAQALAGLA